MKGFVQEAVNGEEKGGKRSLLSTVSLCRAFIIYINGFEKSYDEQSLNRMKHFFFFFLLFSLVQIIIIIIIISC